MHEWAYPLMQRAMLAWRQAAARIRRRRRLAINEGEFEEADGVGVWQ